MNAKIQNSVVESGALSPRVTLLSPPRFKKKITLPLFTWKVQSVLLKYSIEVYGSQKFVHFLMKNKEKVRFFFARTLKFFVTLLTQKILAAVSEENDKFRILPKV